MKSSDEWETPQWLYDELDKEFQFNIDVCSTEDNCKSDSNMGSSIVALKEAMQTGNLSANIDSGGALEDEAWTFWQNGTYYDYRNEDRNEKPAMFMNPPYSDPFPFIEIALKHRDCYSVLVMLLKVDTSTKWWALFWDYEKHQPKEGIEIRFLPKRLKFELNGVPGDTAPFPSCIIIVRGQ